MRSSIRRGDLRLAACDLGWREWVVRTTIGPVGPGAEPSGASRGRPTSGKPRPTGHASRRDVDSSRSNPQGARPVRAGPRDRPRESPAHVQVRGLPALGWALERNACVVPHHGGLGEVCPRGGVTEGSGPFHTACMVATEEGPVPRRGPRHVRCRRPADGTLRSRGSVHLHFRLLALRSMYLRASGEHHAGIGS